MLFKKHHWFQGGQFYKELAKFGCYKKLGKSQNKVGVAKESENRRNKIFKFEI